MDFDETRQIAIIWDIADVHSRAKEQHINITDEQALEILHNMKRQHDASIGINWDVIDAHLDSLGM